MTTLAIEQHFANSVADHILWYLSGSVAIMASDYRCLDHDCPDRGVVEVRSPFGGRCLAAFGNDDYGGDDRTRTYVDRLVEELGRHDPVLGVDMGIGSTWAIVVLLDDDIAIPLLRSVIKQELYVRYREAYGLSDGRRDRFVLWLKSICDRQIIKHIGGEPLAISGWESLN